MATTRPTVPNRAGERVGVPFSRARTDSEVSMTPISTRVLDGIDCQAPAAGQPNRAPGPSRAPAAPSFDLNLDDDIPF